MAPAPRPLRLLLAVLLLPGLAGLLLAAGSGTAQAADGYKYWNYFHVKGDAFVFAKTGPADFKPKDGSVEAYRYGLTSSPKGLPPRTSATMYSIDDLCAGKKAGSGQKRVGVLLDFGTAKDAPSGESAPKPRGDCAVVAKDATGQQVLAAVADVRMQKTFLCGIDGYPAKDCSVTVKNSPKPTTGQTVQFAMPAKKTDGSSKPLRSDADQGGGGVPWPLVLVVVLVVVLAAGGFLLSRRNRAG